MSTNRYREGFQIVTARELSLSSEERIERERWERVTATREVTPAPLHVDIELTNACNLRCIMCERHNMRRRVGFMDMKLYEQIIQQCVEYGIRSIKLNLWGESLLHGDLLRMIARAKERGIVRVQFNTNGVFLDETLALGIFRSGLDHITFSVDGTTKETYELIRQNSSFDTVMGNLERMFALRAAHGFTKPRITLQIIQMKDTQHEIETFIQRWKEKADFISVTNIGTTSGSASIKDRSVMGFAHLRKVACPQLWQRLSVGWNGDVTPCCADYDFHNKLGSLPDSDLRSLWNCQKLSDLRREHTQGIFNGICKTCTENVAPRED